ncbi:MAG: DUF4260 domain-containing protein [Gemmatimonas sp.]|jgi:hypothetical protein
MTADTTSDRLPVLLLRVEGLALLAVAATAYDWHHGAVAGAPGWGLFFAAFLLPDVAMLGYVRSTRVGAWCYNLAHTESLPALALGAGIVMRTPMMTAAALIWLAHIGFDRLAGYGLKFAEGFGRTHLGDLPSRASRRTTAPAASR